MLNTPHPPVQPGYNHSTTATPQMNFTPHLPPPLRRRSSDDWIHRRLPTPGAGTLGSAGFSTNFLMNADAQRHAFLKKLLSPEVRSCIVEYLEDSSSYFEALEELKKRYGQSQVVARSHLIALMNLPAIRDDDPHALAKLNRTLHGAMHALRTAATSKIWNSE
ncbi:hypothetical protein DAPPUDRAFT_249801 [Daphnia pulex]|uniref:Uncharacterized protein n=1 Tax=Daphnia pulex TaxID=6669 RepID=E9GXB6_DAPPU|nr:hypothetical protein DAPPUDRAFT_249801 [Daphnia pulex]|eukprot:EFX75890.1 hypothetical protein DAPPUDRAFT_249801 [Daphnia pulex]